ncbi:dienelactone hydrolase family protein [Candidatus Sumerlaeota bacterium]|nr:dienelactone hydrolase family protein [Candidatus Sumerlaeota bacterium]
MQKSLNLPPTQEPHSIAPPIHKIPVEAAGYYYVDIPPQVSDAAPALVGLHGYGQTAPDFLEVLRKWAPGSFACVAPQGFHQLWDRETRKISFSWLSAFEKSDNIARNNRFLASMLGKLSHDKTLDPKAVFMLGFSQGSSVTYRFAQHHPALVRGIISVCSDLPPDVEAHLAPLKHIPVLILYGLRDPIFSPEKALHAADALRAAGMDTEIISFDRGHIMPSSLAPKVQDWLNRILSARRDATPND